MTEEPRTRWQELTGGTSGEEYAARFAALADAGQDMHGEATFCARLVAPPARILDAGCGTGRVAIRLAELGYDVVGADVDASMLAVARRHAPNLAWIEVDLAKLAGDLAEQGPFDLIVMAGNVVPLLGGGSLPAVAHGLARLLAPAGRLVAGFGLDHAHLPAGCPVTPLQEYDAALHAAGLTLQERFSIWDGDPFDENDGYAVTVHRPA